MLNTLLAATPLLLLLAAPGSPPAIDWARAIELVQQQQNITIHVPRVTMTTTTIIVRAPAPPPMKEKKANDCVKIDKINGYSVFRPNSIDLLLNDGKQLRVNLANNCPALGFYSGFYVKPAGDKKICAGRDSFRLRSGRLCGIQSFRSLVPAR